MPSDWLTREEIHTFREAISGSEGMDLLDYLSGLSMGKALDDADGRLAKISADRGWVKGTAAGKPHLTDKGQTFADSSREYRYWLANDRKFPEAFTIPVPLEGKRVLDVGCGCGRYLMTLEATGAQPVGVDFHSPYLQLSAEFSRLENRRRPRVARATASQLPFPDQSFDALVCISAIAYMEPREALAEFARVLVRGGILMLNAQTLGDYVRMTLRDWRKQLKPRTAVRSARNIINSCSSAWFGKRLSPGPNSSTLGRPIRLTHRFLMGHLSRHGMECVNESATPDKESWFVFQRQ